MLCCNLAIWGQASASDRHQKHLVGRYNHKKKEPIKYHNFSIIQVDRARARREIEERSRREREEREKRERRESEERARRKSEERERRESEERERRESEEREKRERGESEEKERGEREKRERGRGENEAEGRCMPSGFSMIFVYLLFITKQAPLFNQRDIQ